MESDSLLDLGYIEPIDVSAGDDFVLDLDVEEAQNGSLSTAVSYEPPAGRAAFIEPEISPTASSEMDSHYTYQPEQIEATEPYEATLDVLPPVETRDFDSQSYSTQPVDEAPHGTPISVTAEPAASESQTAAPVTSATQLSPEMIDAIARRAVEMMSDKVVREVAWEVVPELAELLIKRQLEEKESQPK
jgi:hypothetical protein